MFDPGDPRNELYSRPAYFKVFVSSKMAGGVLVPEREAAVDAVEEFPLARAWAWERDAPAGSYYSKEECVRQAGTSEAIVLIVEDELTAWSEEEAVSARLEEDLRLARSPTEAALALKSKLGRDGEGWRYTPPSYEFSAAARQFSVPGVQGSLAYETALANLAPGLERHPEPEDVTEVLRWAAYPLASREVARSAASRGRRHATGSQRRAPASSRSPATATGPSSRPSIDAILRPRRTSGRAQQPG